MSATPIPISIHSSKLTPFQRSLVKELNKLCSPCIPFRIAKSTNNHMQIWIDDCPLITTSASPSDFRAKKTAIAEIRRALRDRKERIEKKESEKKPETQVAPIESPEKIISAMSKQKSNCALNILNQAIAYITKSIEKLKEEEMTQITKDNDIGAVAPLRHKKATDILNHCIKNTNSEPFDDTEINALCDGVLEHLNFHLPTNAIYSEIFKLKKAKSKSKSKSKSAKPNQEQVQVQEQEVNSIEAAQKVEQPNEKTNNENPKGSLIDPIMAMRRNDRIEMFRLLSEKDLANLAENIEEAVKRNHTSRISKITDLMNKGNITIEDIQLALAGSKN